MSEEERYEFVEEEVKTISESWKNALFTICEVVTI